MAEVTYLEAIRQALDEEMARDPSVVLIGEDIGVYGGAFKATDGLLARYGWERVIDTPISETAIIGAAVGMSYLGLRPVAEMQFMDFIACCFNQITNFAAKSHYRWGAPAPIVVRGPSGGGVHGGPFHSANPETYFAHTPGLKVICPATAHRTDRGGECPYECVPWGTFPATAIPNLRRPLLNTRNIADLLPLTSVWPGLAMNPSPLFAPGVRLSCGPRLPAPLPFASTCTTPMSATRLVLGKTGSGKSVLLGLIAAQFRRYARAQVFVFECRLFDVGTRPGGRCSALRSRGRSRGCAALSAAGTRQ